MTIRFEQLYRYVEIVVESKIEEFCYYGYKAITKEQLWNYCLDKKWRKKDVGQLHLYEIVATIYDVQASNVMNYEQANEFRATQKDEFQPIQTAALSKEELDFLLCAPVANEEKE